MSQTNKLTKSSSLSTLSSPSTSAPPSPSFVPTSSSQPSSTVSNSTTIDEKRDKILFEQKMKQIELKQFEQSNTMNEMKDSMNLILQAIQTISKTQKNESSNTHTHTREEETHTDTQKQKTSSSSDSDRDSSFVQPIKVVQSRTLSHREQVKDDTIESTKSLFNISEAKQRAIADYSTNNLTFDLSDTIIDMNETKYDKVSNQQNISFISQLLPTNTASDRTSLAELLQSGIKVSNAAATTGTHKIKDVHQLLELLTEQAKAICASDNANGASEYLIYTLNLMKLLFEYGLNATLDYHFKLMKRIQTKETKLTTEQPMLMLDVMSKYKRVVNDKLLHSTLLYSNSNKPTTNNKSNGARTTTKFTGTPCSFHTKQLGKPANHSDEQCRFKGK
jgi:hypothetical protein